MEEIIGKICPFCRTEIKEGDEVKVCPACGTPHHEGCWNENNGCTTFGCSEQHYKEQETKPVNVCSNCGTALDDGQLFCPSCGTQKEQAKNTFCSKCGNELQTGQEFCPKCGQKVDLQINPVVNSAIAQYNTDISNISAKKKKKPAKILISLVCVIAVVVLACFVPNLIKGTEDYLAIADYENAYIKADSTEKDTVLEENLVAYCSKLCVDLLKDGSSFDLRAAWYNPDSKYVVLKVSANNSNGNPVINWWLFNYDTDDSEWQYYNSVVDLTDDTYSYYDDYEDKIDVLFDNLTRDYISDTMISSYALSEESVSRINSLKSQGILGDVTLLNQNK